MWHHHGDDRFNLKPSPKFRLKTPITSIWHVFLHQIISFQYPHKLVARFFYFMLLLDRLWIKFHLSSILIHHTFSLRTPPRYQHWKYAVYQNLGFMFTIKGEIFHSFLFWRFSIHVNRFVSFFFRISICGNIQVTKFSGVMQYSWNISILSSSSLQFIQAVIQR